MLPRTWKFKTPDPAEGAISSRWSFQNRQHHSTHSLWQAVLLLAGSTGLAQDLSAQTNAPVGNSTQTVFEAQGPTLNSAKQPVDKSRFTLFNPTPAENLRDINALYNGPYTVDAGHLQVETVAVLYARDHYTAGGADITTSYLSLGSTTFRLGLLNNLDFGVTIPPHIRLRTRDRTTGATTTQSGLGDITLRAKLNLWGNDGGSTAFGPSSKFVA